MAINVATAVKFCRTIIQDVKNDWKVPGIVVGVSVGGDSVWLEGFGYSDLENNIECQKDTVMRIASVCKTFTAVAAAKLFEENKLDWDKSIQHYIPDYPEVTFNGEKVNDLITPRVLASHCAGLRHYDRQKGEYERKEHFNAMKDVLDLFKYDPILFKPATNFSYSAYGYSLLGNIVENIAGVPFVDYIKQMLHDHEMFNTHPDENHIIISNRSKSYCNNNGIINNAPYTDSSCKWASGGYVSTVGDLLKFGNSLVRSWLGKNGYLKSETLNMLWTATAESKGKVEWEPNAGYGLGFVSEKINNDIITSHIGRATGGSSVLLVMIVKKPDGNYTSVIVTIMTNLDKVPLQDKAKLIAFKFRDIINNH